MDNAIFYNDVISIVQMNPTLWDNRGRDYVDENKKVHSCDI